MNLTWLKEFFAGFLRTRHIACHYLIARPAAPICPCTVPRWIREICDEPSRSRRMELRGFECRQQQVWFYDSRLAGEYPLTVRRLVDAAAAWHA